MNQQTEKYFIKPTFQSNELKQEALNSTNVFSKSYFDTINSNNFKNGKQKSLNLFQQINQNRLASCHFFKIHKSLPAKKCKAENSFEIKNQILFQTCKELSDFQKTMKIPSWRLFIKQKSPYTLKQAGLYQKKRNNPQSKQIVKKNTNKAFLINSKKLSSSNLQSGTTIELKKQNGPQTFDVNVIKTRLKLHPQVLNRKQKFPCFIQSSQKKHKLKTEVSLGNFKARVNRLNQLKIHSNSKRERQKKRTEKKLNLKQKSLQNTIFIPSLKGQQLKPQIICNLLQKVQLSERIDDKYTEPISQQLKMSKFKTNLKLERQIQSIQSYFMAKKNDENSIILKKQLAKIKNKSQNSSDTVVFNENFQKLNEECKLQQNRVGKIIKQCITEIYSKSNGITSQQNRNFQLKKEDDECENKTIALHDNIYRQQIVQLDSSTSRMSIEKCSIDQDFHLSKQNPTGQWLPQKIFQINGRVNSISASKFVQNVNSETKSECIII